MWSTEAQLFRSFINNTMRELKEARGITLKTYEFPIYKRFVNWILIDVILESGKLHT